MLALVVSLAAGAVAGLVMGGLAAYLTLPSFMTTLAGLTSIRGLTYLLTNGTPAGGNLPHGWPRSVSTLIWWPRRWVR